MIEVKNPSKIVNEEKYIDNCERDANFNSTINNVSVIMNKNTKNFYNTNNKSDLIQTALEYNNYLITELTKNKITDSEKEYCINSLLDNLIKLSKNGDNFVKHRNLLNSKRYLKPQSESHFILSDKKKNKNDKISNYDKNYSGLTIIVDKSILKNY